MLDTTTEARADGRLREEMMIWLTTVRSDGKQSVPVWFLRAGETFLIHSQPKLKNIGRDALVGLHLNANDRGGVVRAEGTAEMVQEIRPANEGGEYLEKYGESVARIGFGPEGFARAYSVALRMRPDRLRVW